MPEKYQVTIIQPKDYIHSLCFNEVALLLKYSLESLGHECEIELNSFSEDRINIILGYHLLGFEENLKKYKYIPYQLEQLSFDEGWALKTDKQKENMLSLFNNAFSVWDYSQDNIDFLKNMGVNALYLPVGYHEKLELIEQRQEKDIDVLFYGCVNERRKKVLDELAGTKLVVLFGKYGKERDELIARSKIILNIHFYERKILEVVRISYLLNNGCFVVSEESEINPYSDVKITIGPYGDLANICRHYLSDYKSAILTGKNNYMLFKEKHIMDKGLKQILQPYIVL